jgi:hypothetical protein
MSNHGLSNPLFQAIKLKYATAQLIHSIECYYSPLTLYQCHSSPLFHFPPSLRNPLPLRQVQVMTLLQ